MNTFNKIACLQTKPASNFNNAISEALKLAEKAISKGAKFLFLPEYCGGLVTRNGGVYPPTNDEASHPFLGEICSYAREKRIWMLLGSISISYSETQYLNRGYIINDLGIVQNRYDQVRTFGAKLEESNQIIHKATSRLHDNTSLVVDTPFGRVGYSILSDLKCPIIYREMAKLGAEILTVSATMTTKLESLHWHILNKARAIENGAYVIAPSTFGKIKGGGSARGHSLTVNPWGDLTCHGTKTSGAFISCLDLEAVKNIRQKIPSLEHDRSYKSIIIDYKTESLF